MKAPGFTSFGVALLLSWSVQACAGFIELDVGSRWDYAFDSAGVLYITAGSDIVRYDTQSGQYLAPFSIGGDLRGIDLSADGQTLAVADGSVQGSNNRIRLVDSMTGAASDVSFPRAFGESGTYMVAWGQDNRLLVSSSFSGSGWVPLRRYDPQSEVTETIASVRQNTMLTPSADRLTIGLAEANISSGPIHAYDVAPGTIGASIDTDWFTDEVAVSRDGTSFLVPTYGGGLVYDRDGSSFTQVTELGEYASYGPLGGAFSPVADVLFTAEYDWDVSQAGVMVYDTQTWTKLATVDDYPFSWTGSGGRTEISPDGRWLSVSVEGGVRLYDVSAWVPEPGTGLLALVAVFVLRGRRST